MNKNRWN